MNGEWMMGDLDRNNNVIPAKAGIHSGFCAGGNPVMRRRLWIASLALAMTMLLLPTTPAYAVCSNPAGTEGAIIYNGDTEQPQYCDGTNWNAMLLTDGKNGCTGPSSCPNVGDECADGTVFAGCPGNSYQNIFTTHCDAGQTWGGASCSGTRSTIPWNNGNTTGYVATGATDQFDGPANTATIITIDSDSGAGGTQPHQAAQYCADLSQDGHDDWYLPSRAELQTIWVQKTDIGDFVNNVYWTSTDKSTNQAHVQHMKGNMYVQVKDVALYVRCVRR